MSVVSAVVLFMVIWFVALLVALPIGLGIFLWVHVSRVARPALLPPRPLMWTAIGLLFVLSVVWPIGMAPEADLFREPGPAPFDVFYSFFVPFTSAAQPWAVWGAVAALALLFLFVPLLTRPRAPARPMPSWVDERLCTGCEQCYLDCPYEAISMIDRTDGRPGMVRGIEHVDPDGCRDGPPMFVQLQNKYLCANGAGDQGDQQPHRAAADHEHLFAGRDTSPANVVHGDGGWLNERGDRKREVGRESYEVSGWDRP